MKRIFIIGRVLKQFKTVEDLNGFLDQLQKRGLEAILNCELNAYLGYVKH